MQAVADSKKTVADEDILALMGDEASQDGRLWDLLDLQVCRHSAKPELDSAPNDARCCFRQAWRGSTLEMLSLPTWGFTSADLTWGYCILYLAKCAELFAYHACKLLT